MDLSRAIEYLYAERDRLVTAIAQLESLNNSGAATTTRVRSRRGRKSMGAAERREVSERMRKYWARRRKAQGGT